MNEIDFYEVVKIVDSEDTRLWEIANKEGIVVGKAYEDDHVGGKVVGYDVSIDGESFSVDVDELTKPGRSVNREDLYSGESIRVSATGEYLGPGDASR